MTLRSRRKRFMGKMLFLERWSLGVGCLRNGAHLSEIRVRIVGFLVHLWEMKLFVNMGNACSGFVAVDEDTTYYRNFQWARVLVKARGRNLLGMLNVVVSFLCFAVQLWWECPPWVDQVDPRTGHRELKVEKDFTSVSCVEGAWAERSLCPKKW